MAKGDIRQGSAPLKKVLELMLEDMGLSHKLNEAKVLDQVTDLLGNAISNKIHERYIYEGKLFLKTHSAPLRNELFVIKAALLEKIKEAVPEIEIEDIVIR